MNVRTTHLQPLFVATLVLVLPYVVLANSESCALIDPARAAQFISYEGMSEGTSDSDVLLRPHNNSDCPIIVESDDHDPFVFQGKKNASVHYLLHDPWRATLKPGYGWGDSVFTVDIRGGESVWFRVPLTRLNRRLAVAVPFEFAWEANHVGAFVGPAVQHYVYFFLDRIPAKKRRGK